jgi:23S rRNA (adenine2030-N6)-methyltransferase
LSLANLRPFESPLELRLAANALNAGLLKWPTGIFAFWYPIKGRSEVAKFRHLVDVEGIPIFSVELLAYAKRREGLTGSGMVIFNPPWQFDKDVKAICAALVPIFAEGGSSYSTEWWERPR